MESFYQRLLAAAMLFVTLGRATATPSRGDSIQLWACSIDPDEQRWTIGTAGYPNNRIVLRANASYVCDISEFSNSSDTKLQIWQPNAVKRAYNQQFEYNADTKQITSLMNGFCVTAVRDDMGAVVVMDKCTKGIANPLQQWEYDNSSGQIFSLAVKDKSLCLDAGSISTANCSVAPYSTYPYCNPALSIPDRINDLLPRLTLAEKTAFLSAKGHTNGGVPRLGVAPFTYGESLHGVNCKCGEAAQGSTGCATSFPHALGLSATFNRTLWALVGQTISTEGRALHNQGMIGLAMWAPDINLFRDPRWGRGQEVPGEDPYLTAEYVAHYSRALQEGDDPRYLKLISSCKHFSAYDLENWYNFNRHNFSAQVSDQDLAEYYWVPFRSCVERAHAKSIMCSYNAVNGVPSCANGLFQNEIVRNEWGFDGFFVSDCGAISNINGNHNYTNSSEESCKAAIEGGTDTNCGMTYAKSLEKTVTDGLLSVEQVEVSVRRVMEYMFRTGVMDPTDDQPYTKLNKEHVDTPAHRQIALEAAHQMIVLLKNEKNLLPLSVAKVKSVALIGPQANETQGLLSNYHGTNTLVDSHSILAGLTNLVGSSVKINYLQALTSTDSADTGHFDDAVSAAKSSDVAIVCVGLSETDEKEGHDRYNLTLPGAQGELVEKIFKAQPNTIVVLINGGPLAIEYIKDNIPAIVEAFYPGELGGDAVADVLFGKVNPSGRLPITVYPADYIKRSYYDMSLRDNGGCTYLHYSGDALWQFGDGLSYTTFTYEWESGSLGERTPSIASSAAARFEDTPLQYTVVVKNTGDMAGGDSVLGFLKSVHQSDAPIRELFDFGRVVLQPGESATVHLTVGPQELSLTDHRGVQSIRGGEVEYEVQVGSLHAKFYVHGPDVELFNLERITARYTERMRSQ